MPACPPAPLSGSRRSFLIGGAGLVLTVSGCTFSDPRVSEVGRTPRPARSQPATPMPSPTPILPGSATAAELEVTAAAQAAAVLAARGSALPKAQRVQLGRIQAAHVDHAAALRSQTPTTRPTETTALPSATPRGRATLADLVRTERRLAKLHREAALAASGQTALLWGSLHVSASAYAAALGSDRATPVATPLPDRIAPEVLSDAAGMQQMVTQLHAMIYGYQLALGKLPVLSSAHARALTGLTARRALRDRLTLSLIERSANVPVAEPAYVPSVRVRNASTAASLIGRMEAALLPFCGQWLASAGRAGDRRLALDTLSGTARSAWSWGAALPAWPGWPV